LCLLLSLDKHLVTAGSLIRAMHGGCFLALSLAILAAWMDGQSVPVGVGQPMLKIDSMTVGGTASSSRIYCCGYRVPDTAKGAAAPFANQVFTLRSTWQDNPEPTWLIFSLQQQVSDQIAIQT
jgi:hypothetical protein